MTKFLRLIACVLLVALVGGLMPMALAEPVPPLPMRVLGMGDKGEDIVRLQNRLVTLEYTRAAVTGKFNRSTMEAVKRVQSMLNVRQTGVAGLALQEKLYADSALMYNRYVSLKKGMRDDIRVYDMQVKLRKLGYPGVVLTSNYDSRTVRAVRLFQSDHGFEEQSQIGPAQLQILYATSKQYARYAPMRPGDQGVRVMRMKERLKQLGYLIGALNNRYDKSTKIAIMDFQRRVRIKPSGNAGEKTLRRLYSDKAPHRV
ncbi:MAG: peptidoglycan-binding protein [Clostridia bacterium]